jgi:hypothetical protein
METNYRAQMGDIFLCDSDRPAAKMAKFFMIAPTLWQYLWRKLRHTQQVVNYYHAGMILNDSAMIEQQGVVQYGLTQKILSRKIVIYRKKSLTITQQMQLSAYANSDLGRGYGIALILGKTLSWLTGIIWFQDFIGRETKNQMICINRVCKWYREIDLFGVKSYFDSTTKTVDEFCANSHDWEVVYKH